MVQVFSGMLFLIFNHFNEGYLYYNKYVKVSHIMDLMHTQVQA